MKDEFFVLQRFESKFYTTWCRQAITHDKVKRGWSIHHTLTGNGSKQKCLILCQEVVAVLVINFLFAQDYAYSIINSLFCQLFLGRAIKPIENLLNIPGLPIHHII